MYFPDKLHFFLLQVNEVVLKDFYNKKRINYVKIL